LLHKELDADDEEVTRTRKVRRATIAERYRDIIDALYGPDDHVQVDTEFQYQDGRRARIQADLRIYSLPPLPLGEGRGEGYSVADC
jgi:long-chain acyl-CoA synthetase